MPKELCVCETIAKESKKIKVSVIQKRYGKFATVIKGVDSSEIDIRSLIKILKTKLACGGTYKNNQIELQGDHKEKITGILEKEGFPRDIIEVD